jgi:two-component system LytT family response regulator
MINSETISAIIIDDEQESIHLLEMYLRQFAFIKVSATETNAVTGLQLVRETLPELVFLDIDMPDMNGLQVANHIHSDNFYSEIIFTTAHQQYAYEALDIKPLDFLTKPFSIDDLEKVIKKYQEKVEKRKYEVKLDRFIQSQTNSPKIKFPSTQGLLITEMKDIVMLKAKSNNCNIYLADGTYETITRNLYIVIRMLNSPTFFQINRSICINLNYLQRVDKRNQKCILAFNGTIQEVEISRANLTYFEKLNIFPIV